MKRILVTMIILWIFRRTIRNAHKVIVEAKGDLQKLQISDEEENGLLDLDSYYRLTRTMSPKQLIKDLKHAKEILSN